MTALLSPSQHQLPLSNHLNRPGNSNSKQPQHYHLTVATHAPPPCTADEMLANFSGGRFVSHRGSCEAVGEDHLDFNTDSNSHETTRAVGGSPQRFLQPQLTEEEGQSIGRRGSLQGGDEPTISSKTGSAHLEAAQIT